VWLTIFDTLDALELELELELEPEPVWPPPHPARSSGTTRRKKDNRLNNCEFMLFPSLVRTEINGKSKPRGTKVSLILSVACQHGA
jgi:hypothetical protein